MINLALVDDHNLFRICLNDYLHRNEDFRVKIQEEETEIFLQKLPYHNIDILVTDLFMPKKNGDRLIEHLKEHFPHIKIIVLSMCTDLAIISKLIDMGIHSFICKTEAVEELVKSVYAVHANKICRNKLFTDALYWNASQNKEKQNIQSKVEFSEREKRIIQLLWQEKSNKEISNELFLGMRSIEKIRQDMKIRLGVKTTIGLLKYALSTKIIDESFANTLI